MIGSTQPKRLLYNRQQFLWLAQESDGFKALAATIGADRTAAIVDLIFDLEVRETNPTDRYVLVRAEDQPAYAAGIDKVLETECSQIRETKVYVTTLLKATMAGELRGTLAGMAEPETNYTVPRKLPPEGTRKREIAKASDWIACPMHGDGRDAVFECLTRHVVTQPCGQALGRAPADLLDKVHAEIVPEAPKFRSPNSATVYPSSIGGRFLLEMVFNWTSKIIWPGPREEIWQDVALFYLGAVASVQGYPDGNKRAARLAYCLTLLKAGLPFIAPNMTLESGLVRMTRSESD